MKARNTKQKEYDGSTPLKSVMQEMFVSKLLTGMTQYEAYKAAGYKTKSQKCIEANAARLKGNERVLARIEHKRAELEAKTLELTAITRERQVQKYEEHRQKAVRLGQISAANGAIRGQSELVGLHDTAQETFEKMSLAAALSQASRRKAIDSTVQQKVIESPVEPDGDDQPPLLGQKQGPNSAQTGD
jgi:hypothetical protein